MKAAEGGLAFSFVEGALIRAVRKGWWVLLDEINLAPPEVSKLQWPCRCRWWQGTKCKRRGIRTFGGMGGPPGMGGPMGEVGACTPGAAIVVQHS